MGHGGGGTCPHLYKWLGMGANSKQETDQTVLTITKALTKTTSCAFRAKNGGHDQKKLQGALRRIGAPPLSLRTGAPTFKFVPVPLVTTVQFRVCVFAYFHYTYVSRLCFFFIHSA